MSSIPVSRRWLLLGLAGSVAILGLDLLLLRHPEWWPPEDFVEYWSAGVVAGRGGNPYDPEALRALQIEAGRDPAKPDVVMMWNPPWTLVLVVPLGWMSPVAAHILWVEVQVLAMFAASVMLWRVYRGPPEWWWAAPLLAISAPLGMLVTYGHPNGFVVLGLAGFLYFHDRKRPAVAGMFAALTALKPHLLFAFGVVLLLDGVTTRRGRIALASGVGVIAFAGIVAWFGNPLVYSQYLAGLRQESGGNHVHPMDCILPVPSYWLRIWLAPEEFWVQMVPTVLAVVVVWAYWFPRRREWDWPAEMPRLVFLSVLAVGYGAWIFDLVVLLVPIIAVAARVRWERRQAAILLGIPYAILNLVSGLLPALAKSQGQLLGLEVYVYFAPAVLILYLLATALFPPQRSSRAPAGSAPAVGSPGREASGIGSVSRL